MVCFFSLTREDDTGKQRGKAGPGPVDSQTGLLSLSCADSPSAAQRSFLEGRGRGGPGERGNNWNSETFFLSKLFRHYLAADGTK